jgi:hypothetical protein
VKFNTDMNLPSVAKVCKYMTDVLYPLVDNFDTRKDLCHVAIAYKITNNYQGR